MCGIDGRPLIIVPPNKRIRIAEFARKRQRIILEMNAPLTPTIAHRLMFWRSVEKQILSNMGE